MVFNILSPTCFVRIVDKKLKGVLLLNSYECKKAVSKKDKNQIVWFTDYIPVVDGPFIGVGITGLVLEASDNSNIYEATNITDTVSGTFSEPTDGEVMTAKEFNDYVTQTTEMLKMNSGL